MEEEKKEEVIEEVKEVNEVNEKVNEPVVVPTTVIEPEKKSKKNADNKYTYGYIRFSVLGGVITTTILLVGSTLVIIGAVKRLFDPVDICSNWSYIKLFSSLYYKKRRFN